MEDEAEKLKIYKMLLMLLIVLLMGCTPAAEALSEPSSEPSSEQLETIRESEKVKDEALISEEKEPSQEARIEQADFSPYQLEGTYGDCSYLLEVPVDDWHLKIYRVDHEKTEVFDLAKDNVREQMEFQNAPNRMVVSDEDGDGIEEIYLFFEDAFGSSWMLILNKEDEKMLQTVYYGFSEDIPQYLNIDGEGKPELLTNYVGGGGAVTVWEGLKLANLYRSDTGTYVYSYWMTKKYYEDAQAMAEKNIILNPVEESYAILLKNLAHQGKVADCEEMMQEIDATELILEPDWQGPYETYYEYVLAQASYYEDIWLQIKGLDIYLEEELTSMTEEMPSVDPLNKADLELGNGLFLGMSYDTYCDFFACSETLEFNVDENGNSTGQAQFNMGTIELVFEWSPENESSPLLIEYAVKDEFLKTSRGIGVGQEMHSVIEAYGEPDILESNALRYVVGDTQLVFDLKDNRVTQYRIDNGTGLLMQSE